VPDEPAPHELHPLSLTKRISFDTIFNRTQVKSTVVPDQNPFPSEKELPPRSKSMTKGNSSSESSSSNSDSQEKKEDSSEESEAEVD